MVTLHLKNLATKDVYSKQKPVKSAFYGLTSCLSFRLIVDLAVHFSNLFLVDLRRLALLGI